MKKVTGTSLIPGSLRSNYYTQGSHYPNSDNESVSLSERMGGLVIRMQGLVIRMQGLVIRMEWCLVIRIVRITRPQCAICSYYCMSV